MCLFDVWLKRQPSWKSRHVVGSGNFRLKYITLLNIKILEYSLQVSIFQKGGVQFLARLLILIKKGGLLQL